MIGDLEKMMKYSRSVSKIVSSSDSYICNSNNSTATHDNKKIAEYNDSNNDMTQFHSDFAPLFDYSTLPSEPSPPLENINNGIRDDFDIEYELMKIPRVVLTGNKVSILEDAMIAMTEREVKTAGGSTHSSKLRRKLNLPISRGCGRDERNTFHFSVPSLRLEVIENEYHEPIRDRNKNWVLDSERPILNKDPAEKPGALPLGKHARKEKPPLQWSPQLQALLRKNVLYSTAAVISDTHCFVRIYGIGISGRIFSKGGSTSRVLLIEAYSVWNSTIYSLVLPAPSIRFLVAGREQLCTPGKKKELLKALISLLYFDYTITIYPQSSLETEGPQEIHVHDLEPFSLPESYPQNIADIIGAISTPDSLVDFTRPGLEQKLCISQKIRTNGPVMRRQQKIERLRLQREEEERVRQAWFAIPKRIRGKFAGRCIRRKCKFFVMLTYRVPLKPSIATVRAHVAGSCKVLLHNIQLRIIANKLNMKASPLNWTNHTIRIIVSAVSNSLDVDESSEQDNYFLKFGAMNGPDTLLYPIPTCANWQNHPRSIPAIRRRLLPQRTLDPIPILTDEACDDECVASYSKLASSSTRRHKVWSRSRLPPRRDVGRSIRITTRSARIGAYYGIYTMYMTSKRTSDHLPEYYDLEKRLYLGEFGNDVVPHLLAPQLEVEIDIYIADRPEHDKTVNMPRLLRIKFTRRDLCRMIQDKESLRLALRIGHESFYDTASTEEVTSVENAWSKIGLWLMSNCYWHSFNLSVENDNNQENKALKVLQQTWLFAQDVSSTCNIKEDDVVTSSSTPVMRLGWSRVVYNKVCHVSSNAPRRPHVLMQVIVWQQDEELGVIAFDKLLNEIHFLEPSKESQSLLSHDSEAQGATEITINLSMFLLNLLYDEANLEDGKIRSSLVLIDDTLGQIPQGSHSHGIEDEFGEEGSDKVPEIARIASSMQKSVKTRLEGLHAIDINDIPG